MNLAKETGAEVMLMHVVSWSDYAPYTMEGVVLSSPPPPMEDQEAAKAKAVLEPLKEKFDDSGVKVTIKCLSGDPREELHNMAKDLHAKMIFVGRRGRSRLADLVLGSVADSLAHTAGSMIVLVP